MLTGFMYFPVMDSMTLIMGLRYTSGLKASLNSTCSLHKHWSGRQPWSFRKDRGAEKNDLQFEVKVRLTTYVLLSMKILTSNESSGNSPMTGAERRLLACAHPKHVSLVR